jgi:hypothetical protein
LVAVVKFIDKIGLSKIVKSTVEYFRGDNAVYEISDLVNLIAVGFIEKKGQTPYAILWEE